MGGSRPSAKERVVANIPIYISAFVDDAIGYVASIGQNLLALEKNAGDDQLLRELFRSAHTLKGSSATLGFLRISSLTHEMENVLDAIRSKKVAATPYAIDLLFQCVDALERMVEAVSVDGHEGLGEHTALAAELASASRAAAPPGAHTQAGGRAYPGAFGPTAGKRVSAGGKADQTGHVQPQLSRYERGAVKAAIGDGYNAFLLHVALARDCPMKSVRAYVVIHILEKFAEIVSLAPCAEDIESERFADEFYAVAVTREPEGFVRSAFSNIPDIDRIDIEAITEGHALVRGAGDGLHGLHEPDALGKSGGGGIGAASLGAAEFGAASLGAAEPMSAKPGAEWLAAADGLTSAIARANSEHSGDMHGSFRNVGSQHGAPPAADAASKTVRVDIRKLNNLSAIAFELSMQARSLGPLALGGRGSPAAAAVAELERISASLSESVIGMRMAPIGSIFWRFTKLARSLSRKLGKEVEFQTQGEGIELDQFILSEIKDPIALLINNAIDHGIESAEARRAAGKPARGLVQLRAYRDGPDAVVEVRDDGRGIDIEKVLRKAVETGILSEEAAAAASREEAMMLLFEPAVSTKDVVSEVSGRGVGMDVVKERIMSLGGRVAVETSDGRGAAFSMRIPPSFEAMQANAADAAVR